MLNCTEIKNLPNISLETAAARDKERVVEAWIRAAVSTLTPHHSHNLTDKQGSESDLAQRQYLSSCESSALRTLV